MRERGWRPAHLRPAAGVVMFTGLVQALGTVMAVEPSADGVRLTVAAPLAAELQPGDSVAVNGVEPDGFARRIRIAATPDLLRYVVEKGSIAIDGVSLTVAEVDDESLTVSLIPETLERTSLGAAAPGRTVNLEVDVLAKYVEKLVAR